MAALFVLMTAGACGDPLGNIARVSQGEPMPENPSANVLPTEAELARQGSVLGDLLPRGEVTGDDSAAVDATNLDTAEVSEPTPEALSEASSDQNDVAAAPVETPDVDAAEVESGGGVLAWLRRAADVENPQHVQEPDDIVPAVFTPQDDAPDTQAIPVSTEDDLVEPEKRRGLFGAVRARPRTGPDARDVAVGDVLPFGEIARNCDARPAQMGKLVDKAARKGRGYTLYDTAPDSTTPRTFYINGFADNCARQFTAALALFGEPAFHEQLRYGLPAEEYPYSSTDLAYETLKRRVCNVGRTKPCGDRIDRLTRTTTFLSAYENFTDNARWADMLLHDGAVLASAIKSP